MSQQSQNLSATAMPVQQIQSFPDGANSPMTAGIAAQNQQVARQMALIGKSGGSIRRRHKRRNMLGGAVGVLVPAVPAGAVNAGQVSAQYADLTTLAQTANTNSSFDNSKATPAQVAGIATQQQKLYSGTTGGSKRRILCSSCKKKLTRRKSNKRLNKGKKGRKSRKSRK